MFYKLTEKIPSVGLAGYSIDPNAIRYMALAVSNAANEVAKENAGLTDLAIKIKKTVDTVMGAASFITEAVPLMANVASGNAVDGMQIMNTLLDVTPLGASLIQGTFSAHYKLLQSLVFGALTGTHDEASGDVTYAPLMDMADATKIALVTVGSIFGCNANEHWRGQFVSAYDGSMSLALKRFFQMAPNVVGKMIDNYDFTTSIKTIAV